MSLLAQLIAQMEGYNTPGTIANRLNNPGNLRYGPNQSGTAQTASGSFATYNSADVGWNDLETYINTAASQGLTLRQFTYKYAPPNENDTSNYLNFLSNGLGVSADTLLSQVVGSDVSGNGGGGVTLASPFISTDSVLSTNGTEYGQVGLALVAGAVILMLAE